jgi:hypothetical protein
MKTPIVSTGKYVIGVIAQAAVFYGFKKVNFFYGDARLKVRYGPGCFQNGVAGPARKPQLFNSRGKYTLCPAVKAAKPVQHGRTHA